MARYSTDGSSALAPDDSNDSGNFRVINGGKSNQDHFSQSLDDFNPYYTPYYDNQNKDNPKNKKTKSSEKNANGKSLLRRAENSSLSPASQGKTGAPWENKVQGKAPVIPGPKGIKITKSKKGIVAIIIILLILAGGGIFLGGTNALLGPAINTLFTSNTNSAHASYILRSANIQSYMFRHLNDATKPSWNGLERYRHMSNKFKTKLANNNIKVSGSGADTVLIWKKKTASGGFEEVTIEGSKFKSEYLDNAEFRKDYDTAKRSRIATFFDSAADSFYKKIGVDRNKYRNYQDSGDSETNKKNFRDTMSSSFDDDSTESVKYGKDTETDPDTGEPAVDEDGNPKYKLDSEEVADSNTKTPKADADVKAKNYINSFSQTAQKASSVANSVCAIAQIGNALSITVSALETYQSIQFFMGLAENPSKAIAGDGSQSAINEMLNYFTTPTESKISKYNDAPLLSVIDNAISDTTDTALPTEIRNGAPVQAESVQMILSGHNTVTNDISNFSTERISSSLAKMLRMTPSSYYKCLGMQAIGGVISIVATIASFGTKIVVDFVWDFIKGVAINVAAAAILSFAIPAIATYLFSNVFEDVTGIAAGELFTLGAANANFKSGVSASGQVPASKEAVLAYNRSVNQVAALEAEVDRLTYSPFDITSPNTFFGSIAYSLLPLNSSGITGTFSNILRTTTKSIGKLAGTVKAEDGQNSYMTTFGNDLGSCPTLDAMGIACSVHGTIIPISPNADNPVDDEEYLEIIKRNVTCTDDGNCTITGEDFKNYLVANNNRNSPIGALDSSILSAVGGPVLKSIPLSGDVLDIFESAVQAGEVDWATGKNVSDINSNPKQKEIRAFQQYVEEQRILDEIGDNAYQNPVTAFIDEWDREHPLDNSTAGYIARITGLPKSTAETVLALVEYYTFLDQYDPSSRIAILPENTSIQSSETVIAKFDSTKINLSSDSESEVPTETLLAKQSEQYIIYADIRNRSFTS